MTTQTSFLRRDPAEVTPWAETCGAIRCLIEVLIVCIPRGVLDDVHEVE